MPRFEFDIKGEFEFQSDAIEAYRFLKVHMLQVKGLSKATLAVQVGRIGN